MSENSKNSFSPPASLDHREWTRRTQEKDPGERLQEGSCLIRGDDHLRQKRISMVPVILFLAAHFSLAPRKRVVIPVCSSVTVSECSFTYQAGLLGKSVVKVNRKFGEQHLLQRQAPGCGRDSSFSRVLATTISSVFLCELCALNDRKGVGGERQSLTYSC